MTIAKNMIKKDRLTLEVDFKHVQDHDMELAERILTDFYIHEKTLKLAVNEFVKSIPINQEAGNEVRFMMKCPEFVLPCLCSMLELLDFPQLDIRIDPFLQYHLAFHNVSEQLKVSSSSP
jgi:hypothetical protein